MPRSQKEIQVLYGTEIVIMTREEKDELQELLNNAFEATEALKYSSLLQDRLSYKYTRMAGEAYDNVQEIADFVDEYVQVRKHDEGEIEEIVEKGILFLRENLPSSLNVLRNIVLGGVDIDVGSDDKNPLSLIFQGRVLGMQILGIIDHDHAESLGLDVNMNDWNWTEDEVGELNDTWNAKIKSHEQVISPIPF